MPKHTEINTHAIKLKKGKEPSYKPIYSLKPIELKTLKIYIEANPANSFIRLSKSLAGALILIDKKPDWSLQLYVNYQSLNNIIIKNRYPFTLLINFLIA